MLSQMHRFVPILQAGLPACQALARDRRNDSAVQLVAFRRAPEQKRHAPDGMADSLPHNQLPLAWRAAVRRRSIGTLLSSEVISERRASRFVSGWSVP